MMKRLAYLFLIITFYSCSNLLIPPKNVDDFSRNFVSTLHSKDIDTIMTFIDKSVQNENSRKFLLQTSQEIKNRTLKGFKILNYRKQSNWNSEDGSSIVYMTEYEFSYDNLYYCFSINVLENNRKLSILGFTGGVNNKPIEEIVSFSFSNAGFIHYFFLVFLFLIPAFIIFTISNIAKSKFEKKWLWIIVSLFGVCGIYLNWTTGVVNFSFFSFHLFGIGFTKSGNIAPWIALLSIPIGAIIYWIKRPSLIYDYELLECVSKNEQAKQASSESQIEKETQE